MSPSRSSLLRAGAAALALAVVGEARAQPLARVAATGLQFSTTPPASGFTVQNAFPGISFNQPVAVLSPPGETNRLFIVEKTGRISVINDLANPVRSTFMDISARVGDASGEQGLLAMAFHPDFATNGFFFLYHTLSTTTAAGTGRHDRLARYRLTAGDPRTGDPASEFPLLTQRDEAGNHNGGELLFGPDGHLYLSLGDEGGSNDQFANSQRIDRDFFSCVLRLDVDLRPGSLAPNPHPAVHAGAYAVPPDNPFIGRTSFSGRTFAATSVRTEMFAIGLRNPWRMSLDPATGRIWIGDVGQGAREEINLLERGANFGWPHREGFLAGPAGAGPAETPFVDPVHDYPRNLGFSVTGGLVYRAGALPAHHGAYVFADYGSGRIWTLRGAPGATPIVEQVASDAGIAGFGINPRTGDLLVANVNQGQIRRLVPANVAAPTTLGATGAFADVATLAPAPGVVAYDTNVDFWSDHASKRRWFALPTLAGGFGFAAEGNWTHPAGAVWVKHFDLELTRGDPATRRRIETRFLVKTTDGAYGLSYRWNDAQTDATLVPAAGADLDLAINDGGVIRTQRWRFPGQGECLACHTPQGGHALSFNTRQLNLSFPYPAGAENQLTALADAGYLTAPVPPPTALPALAAAEDLTASLALRARSHLDANCSPCHQPGGPTTGSWDARLGTPLSIAGLVDGALANVGADPANRVIAPGDLVHSILHARLGGTDGGRMPPLASNERDLAGEALIAAWIGELANPRSAPRLVNLASRARVGAENDRLIPGFVIAGDSDKAVLLRAVGPGLGIHGVSDVLTAPTLTVFRGPQAIATNTRWNTAADADAIRTTAARVGAFALPEGGADSALLLTLEPGPYTVRAAGVGATTGEALVEIYDADLTPFAAGASRLVNTAVRARVGGGFPALIPGLVIPPGDPVPVLIRAVGPGLAPFGVTDRLARPTLRLLSGQATIATNTRWHTAPNAATIRATAAAVGAFPLAEGGDDSALLVTLPPGAYTLQLTPSDGGAGIVLAEVYEAP